MDEKLHRCSMCERHLPADEFGKSSKTRSGLQGYCRPCYREYGAKRRAEKRAEKAARDAEFAARA